MIFWGVKSFNKRLLLKLNIYFNVVTILEAKKQNPHL